MIKEEKNLQIYKQTREKIEKSISELSKQKLLSNDIYIFNSTEKQIRPSLIKQDILKDFSNVFSHRIIEPYTSDEYEVSENEIKKDISMKEVCQNIFDIQTLREIDPSKETFPENVNWGLLLKNLDHDMGAIQVKTFLEDIPILKNSIQNLKIEEIRVFLVDDIKFAFVLFSDNTECQKVYEFFNNSEISENNPTFNSLGELITISYCFDFTELKHSKWYAVVLRNLCSFNLEDYSEIFNTTRGILYSLSPQMINNSICSLIIMDNLDNAEKFSVVVNNKNIIDDFEGQRLKANIHPKSDKIRLNMETSHFSQFYKKNFKEDSFKQIKDNISVKSFENNKLNLKKESKINQLYNKCKSNKSVTSSKSKSLNNDNNSSNLEDQIKNEIVPKTNYDLDLDFGNKIKLENMMMKLLSKKSENENNNSINLEKVTKLSRNVSTNGNSASNKKTSIDPNLEKLKKLKEIINSSSSNKKNGSINLTMNSKDKFLQIKRERSNDVIINLEEKKKLLQSNSNNNKIQKKISKSVNPFIETIPLNSNNKIPENTIPYYSNKNKNN